MPIGRCKPSSAKVADAARIKSQPLRHPGQIVIIEVEDASDGILIQLIHRLQQKNEERQAETTCRSDRKPSANMDGRTKECSTASSDYPTDETQTLCKRRLLDPMPSGFGTEPNFRFTYTCQVEEMDSSGFGA